MVATYTLSSLYTLTNQLPSWDSFNVDFREGSMLAATTISVIGVALAFFQSTPLTLILTLLMGSTLYGYHLAGKIKILTDLKEQIGAFSEENASLKTQMGDLKNVNIQLKEVNTALETRLEDFQHSNEKIAEEVQKLDQLRQDSAVAWGKLQATQEAYVTEREKLAEVQQQFVATHLDFRTEVDRLSNVSSPNRNYLASLHQDKENQKV